MQQQKSTRDRRAACRGKEIRWYQPKLREIGFLPVLSGWEALEVGSASCAQCWVLYVTASTASYGSVSLVRGPQAHTLTLMISGIHSRVVSSSKNDGKKRQRSKCPAGAVSLSQKYLMACEKRRKDAREKQRSDLSKRSQKHVWNPWFLQLLVNESRLSVSHCLHQQLMQVPQFLGTYFTSLLKITLSDNWPFPLEN